MKLSRKKVVILGVILTIMLAALGLGLGLYFGLQDQGAGPTAKVEQGVLQGEWVNIPDADDFQYAAFRGIPYASPPTKELRFKAPRPPLKWDGVRKATSEGSACVQASADTPPKVIGAEDCLYLNVYTPRLQKNREKLLPVYFFIHGGSFVSGSGTSAIYGPEFLILQDIVVVTINYRLNVFGFLNLDNDVVPGNAGIKDQVAALKWVQQNIAHFGGDPDEITVGGQSAGAASAHWMTLLPATQGIPKRVILESGSALHSWGYNEDNIEVALDLGRRLWNKSATIDSISSGIIDLPVATIMDSLIPMMTKRLMTLATQLPFAVSPERRNSTEGGEEKLIIQDAEKYIIDPIPMLRPVPMLVGMTNREWLVGFYTHGYAREPSLMDERINDLIVLLPKSIIPYRDTASFLNLTIERLSPNWQDVVTKVKSQFFTSEAYAPDCDKTCTFKKYLDDIVIGLDINRLADKRARQKQSTTYVYRFGVRDKYNTSPLDDPDQIKNGAVHSDELGYIWKMQSLQQNLQGDGLASTTLQRIISMWSTFIKTGIPSPEENFDGLWHPTEQRQSGIIFMDVGLNLTVREDNIAGPRMPFWFDLFESYRENHGR